MNKHFIQHTISWLIIFLLALVITMTVNWVISIFINDPLDQLIISFLICISIGFFIVAPLTEKWFD